MVNLVCPSGEEQYLSLTLRLKWVTFSVTSSMLKTKDAVEEWLEQLAPGNRLQSQWTRATTHLVMTSISLSLKVPLEQKFNLNLPWVLHFATESLP